jgi:pyridoxine 4-oxidase
MRRHPSDEPWTDRTERRANDAPVIDPHYLETEHDRTFPDGLEDGARSAIMRRSTSGEAEVLPGSPVQSDGDLDAFIARAASKASSCRHVQDVDARTPSSTRICG